MTHRMQLVASCLWLADYTKQADSKSDKINDKQVESQPNSTSEQDDY